MHEAIGAVGTEATAWFPMAPPQPASNREQELADARVEALRILDKDAFKLGDLNPLIHPTDLGRKESTDAVRYTAVQKIHEYGGLQPQIMESTVVHDPNADKADLRFVARFEVPSLTEKQLGLLEEVVRQTYGLSVRTRTDSKGFDIPPESYPPTQIGEEMRSKTGGWYMGPAPVPTSSLHPGLFVFRDLGQINKDNFLSDRSEAGKYIIEIREAGQYQTDLVTFITQVATVLGKEELPDKGELLYQTYYDLMRLGLKKVDRGEIYGMDDAIDRIRRELITPLASPEISDSIRQDPQSVLMVGVPGTGKTLAVERLLQEETGIFILPLDPFELHKELSRPKEKQTLLHRIAEVGRLTGRKVVLHVDDMENMADARDDTNSTMLNLMAGVQESGFYLIGSTNYPEKINPSLIQPQRFSVLIHCGLQDEQARYEILKIHADMASRELGMPLFKSDEIRGIILGAVASHANYFTPRYLANIATIAKSHLVDRIARSKDQIVGLTEADLAGFTFDVSDWERAVAEVDEKYDSKSVKERDEELAKFVRKVSQQMGFGSSESTQSRRVFAQSVFAQVAAAEARLDLDSVQAVK